MFKPNKNQILIGIAILAIIVTGLLVFANSNSNNALSFLKFNSNMSADAIAKKSVDFINGNILQGQTATLVSFTEESGVIKFTVKIADKNYDSYATKDGKFLFPEGLKLDSKPADQIGQNQDTQPSAQPVQPTQAPVQPTQ